MIFTDLQTIKTGITEPSGNPPAGSVFQWETIDTNSNLVINYKLHDGTVKTFTSSSGITSIVVDGTSITGAGTTESPLVSHSSGGGSSAGFDPNQAIFSR